MFNKNNKFALYLSISVMVITTTFMPFTANAKQTLNEFIHTVMAERNIPGLQLAVVKDNKIVKLEGYGFADLQHKVPVTNKTLFPINSMTKGFTGVAIVQLAERGLLDLNDTIGTHLPDLPKAWHSLTIKQLMAHTSGLPEILASTSTLELIVPYDIESSWQEVQKLPLLFKTNEYFKYNQTGYVILGKLIDKYEPAGFPAFISENQLKPVGMTQTALAGFDNLETMVPNQARQYIYIGDGVYKNFYGEFAYILRTAAGMSSTAAELANYMIALQNGKLVKNLDTLWEPVKHNNGRTEGFGNKENGYAMGWQIGQRKYHPTVSASGGNATTLITYPEDNVSVVVLTNLLGGLPISFVDEIAAYYIPGFNNSEKLKAYKPMEYLNELAEKRNFKDFPSIFAKAEQDTGVMYDLDILGEWGFALLDKNQNEYAAEVFNFLVSQSDQKSYFNYGLARAYDNLGRYPQALESYKAVLAINPNAQLTKKRIAELEKHLN
ncbi:serine hydrolase [Pseudoalteromonas sp. SSM20]|uniref:serine hydrolase n=1 Tax=Pseudoalteromonas sp. SSM20 TaxID=3139394 RepID=UPI003BAC428D